MTAPAAYTLTVEERLAAVERKLKKMRRQFRRLASEETEVIGFRVEQHDDSDDPEIPDEFKTRT